MVCSLSRGRAKKGLLDFHSANGLKSLSAECCRQAVTRPDPSSAQTVGGMLLPRRKGVEIINESVWCQLALAG